MSNKELGADRALVASDQAATRLAPSGFDHGERVTSDSDEYETTFYGILNKQGEFWTPMPFDSIAAAKARMDQFKRAHLERTHKIVPVRIRLEAIAQTPGQPSAATNNKDQSE